MSGPSDAGPVVRISRRATFNGAHRLHNAHWSEEENQRVYGKCNRRNSHGHNYVVTVTLKGAVDAASGMVINLNVLKREMATIVEMLDHYNLDMDVAYFADSGIVTTAENIAVFFWEMLSRSPEIAPLLHKVYLQETENNSATYKGERRR